MGLGIAIAIFVVLSVWLIMHAIQAKEIKNLRKANHQLLNQVSVETNRRASEIKQLESYLSQDPINIYQLLKAHIVAAKAADRDNR